MWLNKDKFEKCIDWLCTNASPPVRYLTHCNLLNMNTNEKKAKKLWREVEGSQIVQDIFSKQNADGSWFTGGAWAAEPGYIPKAGYSPFTPKYVTTVWILNILGEMGFQTGDPRIDRACKYILTHQLPNGKFLRFARSSDFYKAESDNTQVNKPCETSYYLKALGSVGMTEDPRLVLSYDLLLRWQRDDGGWVTDKHLEERFKTRSCPNVTHIAAVALFQHGGTEMETALYKAMRFLISHLSQKDEGKICKFRFRGHEMLKEMLMYSALGIGQDTRSFKVVLDWLMSMYDEELGHFHFAGRKSKTTDRGQQAAKYILYHCIEDDWLTYHIMRIAKKYGALS